MSILLERPEAGQKASRRVARLMVALAREQIALQRAFAPRLTRAFDQLGEKVRRSAMRNLKAEDMLVVHQILTEVNVLAWRDAMVKPTQMKHYLLVLNRTVATINTTLGLDVMLPDHIAREVVTKGGRRAGLIDYTAQARASLFRALSEGREQGLAREALARHLGSRVAAGRFRDARTRALLISRTETKFAQNVSSIAVYRQAETITGVIAYDNRTGFDDPDCAARDGQVYSFDQAEGESDAEHPNGTLSWAPAVSEVG